MAYTVEFKPRAKREFEKLERPVQLRLATAIDGLAENPRPPGVKKLAGPDNLWRIRVGDYRVIYQISDEILLVLIVDVGHRGDVYR